MCDGVGYQWLCFFFFQAEDGIRDLVRSRGLGDVYKRQIHVRAPQVLQEQGLGSVDEVLPHHLIRLDAGSEAVSYTHLTLPTSDLV